MPSCGNGRLLPSCAEDQRRDPRRIGLERQHHHVVHQLHVIVDFGRNALRRVDRRGRARCRSSSARAIRCSISRTLVRYSSSLRPSRSPSFRRSERASSRTKSRIERCVCWRALKACAALAWRAGAEQPLEHQPRIRLGRHRRVGRPPRDVVLIGTGVAAVATLGLPLGVAGQLERREPREMADRAAAATWSTETPS